MLVGQLIGHLVHQLASQLCLSDSIFLKKCLMLLATQVCQQTLLDHDGSQQDHDGGVYDPEHLDIRLLTDQQIIIDSSAND